MLTNTKHAIWQRVSNNWKDWTALRMLRLPVSQRHSGMNFNYQRSRAMCCTNLMSRWFFALTNRGNSVSGTAIRRKLVCQKNKSIYGLKQTGNNLQVVGELPTETGFYQKEKSLLVRESRQRFLHFHLSPG